ncbi:MAG: ABC transporter permease [Myxococcota bacterium]|nr:ABC transporter permease [Myxococcota bacterium]
MIRLLETFGSLVILSLDTLKEVFKRPFEFQLIIDQLAKGGVDSWSITVLTSFFTGLVIASQFAIGLEPFGASMYTGSLVSLGIVRELGPVLTALLVGGRVGAGFTAELGTMSVTEQIDAIRCLGANPIRKLVMPRVVAMTFVMPLLTILADLIGCLGGALISIFEVGVTTSYAFAQMVESIGIQDVIHGLIKSAFFGYFIAIIACWVGMNARGGAESVGKSTTNTVVYISVTILIADFFLTRFLMAVYG